MNNPTKYKLKKLCADILTNVLTTAANNLVMEAAICANSAGSIPENERNKEKELEIYIRAINGELAKARAQAVIYIDSLVLDYEDEDEDEDEEEEPIDEYALKQEYYESIVRFTPCSYTVEEAYNLGYTTLKSTTESHIINIINYLKDFRLYESCTEELSKADKDILRFAQLLKKSQTEF